MTTLSPPAVQLPSTLWVPPRLGSYGHLINSFADDIGIGGDAEQKRDIDCLASYGKGGRWLTYEAAVIEGRQNGKTKRELLPIALADFFGIVGGEPDRIVWTAHVMKTTLDTFELVTILIDSNYMLSSRVKEIITRKTEEAVILMDGSRMDFIARGENAGRGLSGKRIILDEALFLKISMMGSLVPTLSSRDNPQINYGSSAGKAISDFLRTLQARGRRRNDPSLILVEYRSPGSWDDPGCARGIDCDHIHGNIQNDILDVKTGNFGCAMDREENWLMANHAILAGRMRIEFVRFERRTLCQTPEGVLEFGRERMGWEELGGTSLDPDRIPKNLWDRQTDPKSFIEGEVVFSIDMPPSASHTSICVAGIRPDGNVHFGVVDQVRGSDETIKRLDDLINKHDTMCGVQWCPDAAVKALREPLKEAGIFMDDVTPQQYSESCGAMKEHIKNGTAYHTGSQILQDAFNNTERRVQAEGGWVFGRVKSTGDISPMCGSAIAIRGVDRNRETTPGVFII
jgi:hypothetical protein